jgi:hypothetical protein
LGISDPTLTLRETQGEAGSLLLFLEWSIEGIGDWGLAIGDWRLGIGDWGFVNFLFSHSPFTSHQFPIHQSRLCSKSLFIFFNCLFEKSFCVFCQSFFLADDFRVFRLAGFEIIAQSSGKINYFLNWDVI